MYYVVGVDEMLTNFGMSFIYNMFQQHRKVTLSWLKALQLVHAHKHTHFEYFCAPTSTI